MVRTIRSGEVIEKSQFWVGERKPRADRKKGSTSAAKKDANMRTAIRRLARTINCNFHRADLLLTLDYSDEHLPTSAAEADKQAALFWRRLGRVLAAAGVSLRGFWLTADKDEQTGKPVRLHQHVVLSADGVDVRWEGGVLSACKIGDRELAELWTHGAVDVEPLRQQQDYTALAVYLIRQAVGGDNAKKWHCSRNLKKPEIVSEEIVSIAHELRAPGGANVQEVGRYDELTGTHYIRYIRKPRTRKRRGATVGAEGGDVG